AKILPYPTQRVARAFFSLMPRGKPSPLPHVRTDSAVKRIDAERHEVIRIRIGVFVIALLHDGDEPNIPSPLGQIRRAIRTEGEGNKGYFGLPLHRQLVSAATHFRACEQ